MFLLPAQTSVFRLTYRQMGVSSSTQRVTYNKKLNLNAPFRPQTGQLCCWPVSQEALREIEDEPRRFSPEASTMNDLLTKLSSYNVFNYLLPGVVFAILASAIVHYPVVQHDVLVGAFLYYFI